MTVSNSRSIGQKVSLLSRSREQSKGKWGVQVTICPCLPIILCDLLAHLNPAVEEQKWQVPHVARENRVTNFGKLRMLQRVSSLTCGGIVVSPCQELRREGGETRNNTYDPFFFFFAHIPVSVIKSLLNNNIFMLFPSLYLSF